MRKRAFLTLIALLCIAAFACNSVPFLAHPTLTSTPTATQQDLTSVAAPEFTDIPTPEAPPEPTQTSTSQPQCGGEEGDGGAIEVRWFIGLGTGTDPYQVTVEQDVVEAFNDSQEKIELVLEIVPYDEAKNVLSTEIAAGDGPDIIGPVGLVGSNAFYGQWLEISPYMDACHFDSSVFNPALMRMYETEQGQMGLPFTVYPSLVFYNKKLFDRAGLNYPPSEYDTRYKMPDGSEVDWSWETLGEVARLLTIDGSGRNATESDFDLDHIIQYGYTWQYENHPNYWGSYWAGGSMFDSGDNTAQAPAAWVDAWKWTYEGIWGDRPFIPNAAVEGSQELASGNPFDSGKIAMTVQPIWYTCCMNDVKTWDAAAMPAYNGKVGGRIDADTLRIWKGTKHPASAFTAMAYLVGEGSKALIVGSSIKRPAYGAVPAMTEYQDEWVEGKKSVYPWVKNWDVILAGLNYPDIPSAEGYMPNFDQAWIRGYTFANLLRNTANLDLDGEIATYLNDLTVIFGR